MSKASLTSTARKARLLQLILKQAVRRLPALGSLQEKTLLSLYLSMTPEGREATIGRLRILRDVAGELYVAFLRMHQSGKYSKMDYMTYLSSTEAQVFGPSGRHTTRCYFNTHSNRSYSRTLASSGACTPITDLGKPNTDAPKP